MVLSSALISIVRTANRVSCATMVIRSALRRTPGGRRVASDVAQRPNGLFLNFDIR